MAKSSPLQPSFSAGEFSARVKGRVDSERYKNGLDTCLNYLPTTQGPLIPRPGFKYVGNDAKDPSKPPAFVEFKFSNTQNYVLEFGDLYVRFYTNNGQITTTSTHFKVSGVHGTANVVFNSSLFFAMRSSPIPNPGESILASSVVLSSSVLEIQSPYSYPNVHDLKISQKDDTLYIAHSSYPEYKLQRFSNQDWTIKQVNHQDGPYLPLNTYSSFGDMDRFTIIPGAPSIIYGDASMDFLATTGPIFNCSSLVDNGSGAIRLHTAGSHNFVTGDRVVVLGVAGTVEANNGTSSVSALSWQAKKITDTSLDLIGSVFTNAFSGGGTIRPAIWQSNGASTRFSDHGRLIALVRTDGGRAWGRISRVRDMARFDFHVDSVSSPAVTNTSAIYWHLGVWSELNGYPQAITFHQDRKFLGGTPAYPQQVEASVVGEYENFAASGSSFVPTDNSALQRTLASAQKNPLFWFKSEANGLLAGAADVEWKITPSNQAAALTPSNFNAAVTSHFGSHNTDAVQAGNATLYVQKGQRRVRELNFFYQVDTYRSTDLSELSDHLSQPGIEELWVQKEPIPVIWARRTDGQLVSMVYGRDDQALKVGWSKHRLGGQSDSGGSAPVIKSGAVIPSPDGSFDQLWVAVQRFVNGTSVLNVEYMTKVYDDETAQEDSFHVDSGGSYNSSVSISAISISQSSLITANAHGFVNGDLVKITKVIGLNSSFTNSDGIVFNSNLFNTRIFMVGSAATNTFFPKDPSSNADISSVGYSAYFSGGEVRKLVSTISGATWLKNETVSVLADGKIHNQVLVNSAGVLTLEYSAAVVQFGHSYNCDGKTLRPDSGSQDGTAIGKKMRPSRAAFMLHNVGEMYVGPSFTRLTPLASVEKFQADLSNADMPTPLFSGIARESLESEHNFDGQICFRQKSPLPGMVQTLTVMMETNDV